MPKKFYRAVKSSKCSNVEFEDRVAERIAQLKHEDIESCDDVMSSDEITCKYVLEDTYGAPQAGVDTKEFDEWYEVEEYLDANPDVKERLDEGYAYIHECDSIVSV